MKTLRILIAVAAAAMTLTAATAQQTEPKIIIVKGGAALTRLRPRRRGWRPTHS